VQRSYRLISCFVICSLVLVLTACGGSEASPQPAATATPTPSATDILSKASERMAATQSLRFHLGVDGQTYIDNAKTIQLLEASGELQRPDRVHARFKIKIVPGVTITTEIITIDDQTWSTDIVTGKWGPAPTEFTYDPTVLFDNQGGVGPVMNKVVDPQVVGMEEVQGKDAYHITGTATEEIVGPVTSNTMHGSPVAVDLWIDKSTFDLLQAKLAEPQTPKNDHPATWTLDLFDQDKKITVEPPT
jgi:LppX_LprAFG lipoprotein